MWAGSDLIHFPVTFAVVPHLQQPVLRIVPLAAVRTQKIPAPGCALAIVIVGDSKGCAAAARHQKHPQTLRTPFGCNLRHLNASLRRSIQSEPCHRDMTPITQEYLFLYRTLLQAEIAPSRRKVRESNSPHLCPNRKGGHPRVCGSSGSWLLHRVREARDSNAFPCPSRPPSRLEPERE
jgi:hypothetical protein